MSNTVTFEGKPPEGTINFGIGQPSPDLLPIELVQKATEDFFRVAQPLDINYGVLRGDQRFCESLATFLSKNYGQPVDADSLFLTGGNSQGLDLVCSHLAKPGDQGPDNRPFANPCGMLWCFRWYVCLRVCTYIHQSDWCVCSSPVCFGCTPPSSRNGRPETYRLGNVLH